MCPTLEATRIRRRVLYAAVVALVIGALLLVPFVVRSDEEAYFHGVRPLLVETEEHLLAAIQALSDCLGSFSECVANRTPVVSMLGQARFGLLEVRSSVASLPVPERYRAAHALLLDGLTESADGLLLQMEGLEEPSLPKFDRGSDLMVAGRKDLNDAVDGLNALPPRSLLEMILLAAAVALALFVCSFVVLTYRRLGSQVRAGSPAGRKKESS